MPRPSAHRSAYLSPVASARKSCCWRPSGPASATGPRGTSNRFVGDEPKVPFRGLRPRSQQGVEGASAHPRPRRGSASRRCMFAAVLRGAECSCPSDPFRGFVGLSAFGRRRVSLAACWNSGVSIDPGAAQASAFAAERGSRTSLPPDAKASRLQACSRTTHGGCQGRCWLRVGGTRSWDEAQTRWRSGPRSGGRVSPGAPSAGRACRSTANSIPLATTSR